MTDRFKTHFENNEANSSQAVLLELMTILGKYRQHLYLVGGWAPYYLLKLFQPKDDPFEHVGSIDIDLVIDGKNISENQYASIVDLIEERGYSERKSRVGTPISFSFEKNINGLMVVVDFLAGEYGGTSKNHRHQIIEDELLARKARGADLLPEHHLTFQLEGFLPDGARQSCDVKMANVASLLAMKGITISERYKEKDAYDIYSVLTHYKHGSKSCLEEVLPHLKNGLVHEGLMSICNKFSFEDSVGPTWAAKFIEPENPNEARLRQVEIYNQTYPFVQEIKKLL